MILIWISTSIVCLLVWLYVKWCRLRKYWSNRGVPHSEPSPIFGSLSFLQKENAGKWFIRMRERFNTPYIGIWVFWNPGLIVNSPEIGHNILVKDFDHFRNRYLSSGKSDPIGGLNLFTVNDPLWTNVRRHVSGVFTAAKLRGFQDYVLMKSKELVRRIENENNKNTKMNLRDLFIDFTTDLIGASAFGIKSDITLTGEGPLKNVTKEFSKFSIYRGLCWCSIFFLPHMVDTFRFKFFPKSSTDNFRKIFHAVVSQRDKSTTVSESKDLINTLLKLKRENSEITDDVIIAQAAILLQGGFDTSASMLSFIVYELAYHPHIQENLYDEIREIKEKNGNDDFDSQQLANLTYLDCVIKEGLRKYPPMGWLDRVATSDYKVDDKLTIEAGTVVYVNAIGMHHDPKYFPNPQKFDPDRFLPENNDDTNSYTFLPFGDGPRFCVGMRQAMMAMRFALSLVVLNYKIQPLPDMPKPDNLKIEELGMFYMPGQTMYVDFILRK